MIIKKESYKNVKFPIFMHDNNNLCEVISVRCLGYIISNNMLADNDYI